MALGGDGGSLLVPAVGNFLVQYNFQSIAIALTVMKPRYPTHGWEQSTLSSVVFAGAIAGQVMFGYVGDWIGRNKALALTNFVTFVGALISSLGGWYSSESVYISIAVGRLLIGVGVGGVYPLTAAKAAEETKSTDVTDRSLRVSWAFFWQTPGGIAPFVVTLITQVCVESVDTRYRIILGLGALPAIICSWASLGGQDSEEFLNAKRHHHSDGWCQYLSDRVMMRRLIGTGGSWFLYDVCYYGTTLFAPKLLQEIYGDHSDDVVRVSWEAVLSNSMGLPGVLAAILIYRRIGSKRLQEVGFLLIAVVYLIMAILLKLCPKLNAMIYGFYCVLVFFLNFGPNVTTFTLPAETFPSHCRSTMNGISAAMAKLGALVGTYFFPVLNDAIGVSGVLLVCCGVSLLGIVVTRVYIPDGSNKGHGEMVDSAAHHQIFDHKNEKSDMNYGSVVAQRHALE